MVMSTCTHCCDFCRGWIYCGGVGVDLALIGGHGFVKRGIGMLELKTLYFRDVVGDSLSHVRVTYQTQSTVHHAQIEPVQPTLVSDASLSTCETLRFGCTDLRQHDTQCRSIALQPQSDAEMLCPSSGSSLCHVGEKTHIT